MTKKETYSPTEDEIRNWLQQTASGDETAFTFLLRSHWNKVYTQALTWLRSSHQAQELTQDVFVKIWTSREKLSEVRQFSAYLFIVTRNELISSLRRKKDQWLETSDELAENIMIPYRQAELREWQQRIQHAIDRLPPVRKIVFNKSRIEGLSYDEIGREMGISRNSVKSHIVKALNFLRNELHFPDAMLLLLSASFLFR